MTHITETATAAQPAYADDPDLRILRRVSSLNDFPLADRVTGTVRRIAIVGTETTGNDVIHDEIIDIAVLVIKVDEAGEIVGIASAGQALRDPGMPIPATITRLTGIGDADVAACATSCSTRRCSSRSGRPARSSPAGSMTTTPSGRTPRSATPPRRRSLPNSNSNGRG